MQNFGQFGTAGFIAARHLKAIKDIQPPVGLAEVTSIAARALLNTHSTLNNDAFIR